ncbi:MAG: patatin-like phospholipase family protein [Verrucomicrobiota bacterium]
MAAFVHLMDSLLPFRKESKGPAAGVPLKVGLVFSSGGAKGLAHIGVIQVLEENGVEVSCVCGTSMGAYVGGLWAAGHHGKELEALAASMTSKHDLWKLVDPVFPPRRGFIRGQKILSRLRLSLGERRFDDLEKPFAAVATRLDTLERVVLREGEVASAILSSLAVPGIVEPVKRGGYEYIDGGVSDPLPTRLAREMWNVDLVIAVNVLPPVGTIRNATELPREHSGWKRVMRRVNREINYFAVGNLFDILRGAAMGAQMRLVERSARHADVLISAISPQSGWHDYHRYKDYIQLGRTAALEALPRIESLISADGAAGKTNPNPIDIAS